MEYPHLSPRYYGSDGVAQWVQGADYLRVLDHAQRLVTGSRAMQGQI
jgi:hypothetical protein